MDISILDLPNEILVNILKQLDIESICKFSATCKKAHTRVNQCDYLWKQVITKVTSSPEKIKDDRNEGCSWKEVIQRNHGRHGIKRLWLDGYFSNIDTPSAMPTYPMSSMPAEDWGQILEAELSK